MMVTGISLHAVRTAVAAAYDIDPDLILARTHTRGKVAEARKVCLWIATRWIRATQSEIGRAFDRDRTIVPHSVRAIDRRRHADPEFSAWLDDLVGTVVDTAAADDPDAALRTQLRDIERQMDVLRRRLDQIVDALNGREITGGQP